MKVSGELLAGAIVLSLAAGGGVAALFLRARAKERNVQALALACPTCPACEAPDAARVLSARSARSPAKRTAPRAAPAPQVVALPDQEELDKQQRALRAWIEERAEVLADCEAPSGASAILELERLLAKESLSPEAEACVLERAKGFAAPAGASRRLVVNLVF
jgi:hypothetical protein